MIPALIAGRRGLAATLADGNRSSTGGRAGVRTGRLLVAGQMALAVLLLVVAGLLARTLHALERVDLGFDATQQVLSAHLVLPNSYATAQARAQFFSGWLAKIRALPGVRDAGLIDISPWNGWNHQNFQIERGADSQGTSVDATVGFVSDGYFAAVGTPIVSGRPFAASDRADSQPVAIVSQKFARTAWPGHGALGERIRIGATENPSLTVVGVADDVREDPMSGIDTSVYVPAWQSPTRSYETLIRATGDAHALVPALRDEIRAMDPTVPVLAPRTLDEIVGESLTGTRLPVIFTATFALLALVLAVLGIYGVVAYSVTLRTRELGIRAALGGSRANIIRLVLSDGLRIATAGTAVGLVFAVLGSRLLARLLYGVSPHDPTTYAAAAAVLLSASAGAALIPANRATRIDPVDALRSE
jgi:predicted permease